jgi:signal transduction histidine kinase
MDCGADSFLTKPCETNLLFSTIQNALKNISLINNRQKEKLTFFFGGQTHLLEVNQVQITELLLSTYSNAIQKNMELDEAYHKLNRIYGELERNNKELKELNEQKNQLLGMAAHDLKNPLAVISVFSNFLLNTAKDSIDDAKTHQIIERINDSSTFMIGVIDDFLDFSTIESGILTLHVSEIDLPVLIEKDLLFFESLVQKKNIKLEFNYKKSIPKIRCDPNKISQVLNNLIINGIKFSHPQGTLEVSLNPSDTEIIISVKDSGVGMSPEALASLFQPFSKMKTKGTAGEKGTGLGLAIVHKIVTAHKGKIWVESKLGAGTTFFVSIPYKPKDMV